MPHLSLDDARARLPEVIREAVQSHRPVAIGEGEGQAVLIAAEDWRAIEETLYLLGQPGVGESIRQGMGEPLNDCAEEPGW